MNFDIACILTPVIIYVVGFGIVYSLGDKSDPSGSGMILFGYFVLSPGVLLLTTVITCLVAIKNNML